MDVHEIFIRGRSWVLAQSRGDLILEVIWIDLQSLSFRGNSRPARSCRHKIDYGAVMYITLIGSARSGSVWAGMAYGPFFGRLETITLSDNCNRPTWKQFWCHHARFLGSKYRTHAFVGRYGPACQPLCKDRRRLGELTSYYASQAPQLDGGGGGMEGEGEREREGIDPYRYFCFST